MIPTHSLFRSIVWMTWDAVEVVSHEQILSGAKDDQLQAVVEGGRKQIKNIFLTHRQSWRRESARTDASATEKRCRKGTVYVKPKHTNHSTNHPSISLSLPFPSPPSPHPSIHPTARPTHLPTQPIHHLYHVVVIL